MGKLNWQNLKLLQTRYQCNSSEDHQMKIKEYYLLRFGMTYLTKALLQHEPQLWEEIDNAILLHPLGRCYIIASMQGGEHQRGGTDLRQRSNNRTNTAGSAGPVASALSLSCID